MLKSEKVLKYSTAVREFNHQQRFLIFGKLTGGSHRGEGFCYFLILPIFPKILVP